MTTDDQNAAGGPGSPAPAELLVHGIVILALIVSATILGGESVLSGAQVITVYTGVIAWAAGRQGGRQAERRRQNGA